MTEELRTLTDILVKNNLGFKGGSLLILADGSNRDIGNSIFRSAKAIKTDVKSNINLLDIDYFRSAGQPMKIIPDNFLSYIKSSLKGTNEEYNTVINIARRFEGEQPVFKKITEMAEERGKMGGLSNCTIDILRASFHPENNLDFSSELYDFMLKEEEVIVTCDKGTNLKITMDHNKYRLVNSNGILIPGMYGNPIGAEVFSHPVDAKGTMVISGSYGPLMGHSDFVGKYHLLAEALDETPIYWTFENGLITDVKCENDSIERFVTKYVFETDVEHGPKIGEFGLPANLYLLMQAITGNLLLDEKGRVHIANGDGYQKRTGCEYKSDVHGDGLIANATLRSTRLNKDFMVNNMYSPEIFKTINQ